MLIGWWFYDNIRSQGNGYAETFFRVDSQTYLETLHAYRELLDESQSMLGVTA